LDPLFLGHIQQLVGFEWSCQDDEGNSCLDKNANTEHLLTIPEGTLQDGVSYVYTMKYSYFEGDGNTKTDTCSTEIVARNRALALRLESTASEIGFMDITQD